MFSKINFYGFDFGFGFSKTFFSMVEFLCQF